MIQIPLEAIPRFFDETIDQIVNEYARDKAISAEDEERLREAIDVALGDNLDKFRHLIKEPTK